MVPVSHTFTVCAPVSGPVSAGFHRLALWLLNGATTLIPNRMIVKVPLTFLWAEASKPEVLSRNCLGDLYRVFTCHPAWSGLELITAARRCLAKQIFIRGFERPGP
jgi:hypothetical protein